MELEQINKLPNFVKKMIVCLVIFLLMHSIGEIYYFTIESIGITDPLNQYYATIMTPFVTSTFKLFLNGLQLIKNLIFIGLFFQPDIYKIFLSLFYEYK